MFDDIDNLMDAFAKYVEARQVHDKAQDEYEGYSWGYHGTRLQEAVNKAGEHTKAELNAYIDKRIAASKVGQ